MLTSTSPLLADITTEQKETTTRIVVMPLAEKFDISAFKKLIDEKASYEDVKIPFNLEVIAQNGGWCAQSLSFPFVTVRFNGDSDTGPQNLSFIDAPAHYLLPELVGVRFDNYSNAHLVDNRGPYVDIYNEIGHFVVFFDNADVTIHDFVDADDMVTFGMN
jgi:hypothetical protein